MYYQEIKEVHDRIERNNFEAQELRRQLIESVMFNTVYPELKDKSFNASLEGPACDYDKARKATTLAERITHLHKIRLVIICEKKCIENRPLGECAPLLREHYRKKVCKC